MDGMENMIGMIFYALVFIAVFLVICLAIIMRKRQQTIIQNKAQGLYGAPEDLYGCPRPDDNPIVEDK